jgi:hypothetical protein
VSKNCISQSMKTLIQDNCFSSEELDLLMQRLMDELEQDTMNCFKIWQKDLEIALQKTIREQ